MGRVLEPILGGVNPRLPDLCWALSEHLRGSLPCPRVPRQCDERCLLLLPVYLSNFCLQPGLEPAQSATDWATNFPIKGIIVPKVLPSRVNTIKQQLQPIFERWREVKETKPVLWGKGSSHCLLLKLKIRQNSKTSAPWRRTCSWVKFNRGKSVNIGVAVHHMCLVFLLHKQLTYNQAVFITCILLAGLLWNKLLLKNTERITMIYESPQLTSLLP